jgi:hypothetical protein
METVLTIRIDSATERAVERLARRRRMTKSAVVREALQSFTTEPLATNRRSALDGIADLVGVFRSGRGDLSARTGARLREALKKKRVR